jgi:ABC-type methionine transport system ATPase subunit
MKIKLELNFPGKLKDEPIVCKLCKDFNIIVSILEASFSTNIGWTILVMDGMPSEIEKAKSFLLQKGVEIEDSQELA